MVDFRTFEWADGHTLRANETNIAECTVDDLIVTSARNAQEWLLDLQFCDLVNVVMINRITAF